LANETAILERAIEEFLENGNETAPPQLSLHCVRKLTSEQTIPIRVFAHSQNQSKRLRNYGNQILKLCKSLQPPQPRRKIDYLTLNRSIERMTITRKPEHLTFYFLLSFDRRLKSVEPSATLIRWYSTIFSSDEKESGRNHGVDVFEGRDVVEMSERFGREDCWRCVERVGH